MDQKKLLEFFLKARTKTYAASAGKVTPLLPGSVQYEYEEKDFSYRDVYNIGNKIFAGLETVYYKEKPVVSMSYFGNFVKITEEEADFALRGALMDKGDTARLWKNVVWKKDEYEYICEADGDLNEFSGTETITKSGKQIYYFYYAGGFIG